MIDIPDNCRFSDKDEWVRVEEDLLVIGISDYAQQQLGDVVFIELPSDGAEVVRGKNFGVIESVKAVSDLYSPISGEVAAVNDALADRPEAVNEDCYGEGWMIAVTPSDPSEVEKLMDAAAYANFVAEREG